MTPKEEYIMKKTGLFQNETLFFYTYIAHNGQIYKTTAASLDVCRKLRDRWQRHLSTSFTGHRHIANYAEVKKKVEMRLDSVIRMVSDFFMSVVLSDLIP